MNDELNLKSIIDGKECDVKLTITDKKGNKRDITGFTNSKTNSGHAQDIEANEPSSDNPKVTKINPIEFLNRFNTDDKLSKTISRITFDKNLKPDHMVTYEFNCDGTFALIYSGILKSLEKALGEAVIYSTVHSKEKIPLESIKNVKFVLGEITLEHNYGIVDLPAGRYPGEHDVVSIPIKCEYVE
jgi:hypothetical protein